MNGDQKRAARIGGFAVGLVALCTVIVVAVATSGDRGPSAAQLCVQAGGAWVVTDFYQPPAVIVGSVAVNMPARIEHTCLVGGQVIEVGR